MIEKKIVAGKKTEFAVKEYIKEKLGKGKISKIEIERTPIGERIIIFTSKPGQIIGKGGEMIQSLTVNIKKQFGMENPRIEIADIKDVEFDAQTTADQIAMTLERFGPSSFKIIAYKAMDRLKRAGALGAEIVLGGKLPSERARAWRFSYGYMKKTGETDIVNYAQAIAHTKPGVVGVKVSIVPRDAIIPDRINVESGKIITEIVELVEEKSDEKKKTKSGRKKKSENKESKEVKDGDIKK
jgi:small subunit ribosomal protein S3